MRANPLAIQSTRATQPAAVSVVCSAAIFVSGAALLALVVISGRPFTYPLDDAYIHLTIARTLAQTGVWGMGPLDPAAASSSPLYTLLLTLCDWLGGDAPIVEYAPLGLNICAVAACCAIWFRALADSGSGKTSLPFLLLLSASTPLFVLAFIGMEHTLDVAIATLAAWVGARLVTRKGPVGVRQSLLLLSLGFLAIGIRYENVLLIGPLALVAALNRNWRPALALSLGAAMPILGFGLWWAMAGGWFVPNTILVKAIVNADGMPQGDVARMTLSGILALHLVLAFAHFRIAESVGPREALGHWRFVFSACTLVFGAAQVVLGIVGWLYRYEAAVLSINLLGILSLSIAYFGRRARAASILAIVLITAFRTCDSTRLVVLAPQDRRWEHVATAEFIRDAYAGKTVVVNDIGLAAWKAPETRVLDVVGLASNEIAKLRLQRGGLTPRDVEDWAIARGASAAFLQVCWRPVASVIPDDWILVAVLSGPRNVVFGDRLVGMYATSRANADYLGTALARFPAQPDSRLYLLDAMPAERQASLNRELRAKGCGALDAVLGPKAPS